MTKTPNRFLEIDCGTGVLSIIAAKQGASTVTATDINHEAIKNTLKNAKLHDVIEKLTTI